MRAIQLLSVLFLTGVALTTISGCGPAVKPAKPKTVNRNPQKVSRDSLPHPDSAGQPAAASVDVAMNDAELSALDAAFRDHIAALKDVDAVLQRMFENPINKLPPGALDEPGRRAVETYQTLISLMPPPPAQPMLRHDPSPVERILARYHNEMSQLSGGVVFHLKNAAKLSGNDSEALRKLAAQLEARPK